MENERGQKVDGFPYWARRNYIFVADYGQPDRSRGGVFLGDFDFGVYRHDAWRFGEIIAIGPGVVKPDGSRAPMPEVLKLGTVVAFSRKHGSRLPGDVRFRHPTYPDAKEGLLVRVLDYPDKTPVTLDGFIPWWDVSARQIDPSIYFSG